MRRERLEHRGVEVPARGADGVPGRHDTRTVDPAEVDGLHQRDVEQQATGLDEQPEVANRREARAQRATRVGYRAQRAQCGVVLHCVERARMVGPAEQEVHLHVHEARDEREIADVDNDRFGRDCRRRNVDDVFAVDQHLSRFFELTGIDVEQTSAPQERRRLRRAAARHGGTP